MSEMDLRWGVHLPPESCKTEEGSKFARSASTMEVNVDQGAHRKEEPHDPMDLAGECLLHHFILVDGESAKQGEHVFHRFARVNVVEQVAQHTRNVSTDEPE